MNSSLQMAQAVVFVIFLMAFGAAVSYLVNKALDNAEAKTKLKENTKGSLRNRMKLLNSCIRMLNFGRATVKPQSRCIQS